MQQNRLTIKINKPVSEVFSFTLDPKNTPKWIDFIVSETSSEIPAKKGSIYENTDRHGNLSTYEITEFKKNRFFVFSKKNNSYHVRYTFKSAGSSTELEYFEWVDLGVLNDPFRIEILSKLKVLMEGE